MNDYFECNMLTEVSHMEPSVRSSYLKTVKAIKLRHNKLNTALRLSGMNPEAFAETAAGLFKTFPRQFEEASPEELSKQCWSLWDGTFPEKRIEWPNTTVVFDTRFVSETEWEDMRHFGIGGSDAAAIKGISPYRTAQDLFYDKTGKKPNSEDDSKQAVFDRGHFLEDKVIEAFCKLKGAKRIPESRMFRSVEYPACTSNIDAIVTFKGDLYVFEAKTTVCQNYDAWSNDQVPTHYIDQTRQYPAVLNDPRIKGTYIGCLFTDDLIISGIYCGSGYDEKRFVSRFIPRDEQTEISLLEEEQEFWDEYIAPRILPPRSGNPDEDIRVINQYERPKKAFQVPENIDPNDDVKDLVRRYDQLDQKIQATDAILKQQKLERDDIKVELIKLLSSSSIGLVDETKESFVEIKYQAPKDKVSVDFEKLEVAYPEAFKDCVSQKPQSPRFTLKHKIKWDGWLESYTSPTISTKKKK